MAVPFHPFRRAPGRGPDTQGRVHGLRRPDERNQPLAVPVNGKVLQRQVAGNIVIGIKVHAEVIGTNRHPGHRQVHPRGREQVLENHRTVRLGKLRQRGPSQLIETSAEPLDRLIHGLQVHHDGRLRRRIGLNRLHHLPRILKRGRYPFYLRSVLARECREQSE